MSDPNPTIPPFPPSLSEMGQDLTDSLVESWQILRARNIENANRAEKIEKNIVIQFKKSSKELTDYEKFNTLVSTVVPNVLSQIEAIQADLAGLYDDICDFEIEKNILIDAKNDMLIENHYNKSQKEYNSVSQRLNNESSLHERWVNEQRLKQINKSIEEYKKKTQERYENKLKMAILNANQPNMVENLTTTQPNSSHLTSFTPTKSPLPLYPNPSGSSSARMTPSPQTPPVSIISLPQIASSVNGSTPSTPGLTPKPNLSAVDILEQYANGIPQFDDDFIQ
jgi:hypothetical protein